MNLPRWSRWLLVVLPFLGAVVVLAWWFLIRDPTKCPEGKVWDPVLKECVPIPDESRSSEGSTGSETQRPRIETISFDQVFPPGDDNIFERDPSFLVIHFKQDPELGYPFVDTVTGNYHSKNLIVSNASVGGWDENPPIRLLGMLPDGSYVQLQRTTVPGNAVGAEYDNPIAATPGIRLRSIAIDPAVRINDDDGYGYWVNWFVLAGHVEFAWPSRISGSAIVRYQA